jgi:hypothetical protein
MDGPGIIKEMMFKIGFNDIFYKQLLAGRRRPPVFRAFSMRGSTGG